MPPPSAVGAKVLLTEFRDDIGQSEADIHIELASIDLRPGGVNHLTPFLVLIESQMDRRPVTALHIIRDRQKASPWRGCER